MLQIYETSEDLAGEGKPVTKDLSEHALQLKELGANAAYAALVCIAAAVAYVVASAFHGLTLRIASGVGLALGAHLVLILLMVMQRLFLRTQDRLRTTDTGPQRKKESKAWRVAS